MPLTQSQSNKIHYISEDRLIFRLHSHPDVLTFPSKVNSRFSLLELLSWCPSLKQLVNFSIFPPFKLCAHWIVLPNNSLTCLSYHEVENDTANCGSSSKEVTHLDAPLCLLRRQYEWDGVVSRSIALTSRCPRNT